jgi:8-oxo-dGTP pyrophosphatase MutT (NUDIX family)
VPATVTREISAGGVVVRHMRGRPWVAVIEPQGRPGRVALPKGLVDPGEDAVATAVREVREETGVEAVPLAPLPAVRYVYTRAGRRVFKVVTFHLLRYRSGRIDDLAAAMRREVARAWWLPLADAPSRLSYRGERDTAAAAGELVDGAIEFRARWRR